MARMNHQKRHVLSEANRMLQTAVAAPAGGDPCASGLCTQSGLAQQQQHRQQGVEPKAGRACSSSSSSRAGAIGSKEGYAKLKQQLARFLNELETWRGEGKVIGLADQLKDLVQFARGGRDQRKDGIKQKFGLPPLAAPLDRELEMPKRPPPAAIGAVRGGDGGGESVCGSSSDVRDIPKFRHIVQGPFWPPQVVPPPVPVDAGNGEGTGPPEEPDQPLIGPLWPGRAAAAEAVATAYPAAAVVGDGGGETGNSSSKASGAGAAARDADKQAAQRKGLLREVVAAADDGGKAPVTAAGDVASAPAGGSKLGAVKGGKGKASAAAEKHGKQSAATVSEATAEAATTAAAAAVESKPCQLAAGGKPAPSKPEAVEAEPSAPAKVESGAAAAKAAKGTAAAAAGGGGKGSQPAASAKSVLGKKAAAQPQPPASAPAEGVSGQPAAAGKASKGTAGAAAAAGELVAAEAPASEAAASKGKAKEAVPALKDSGQAAAATADQLPSTSAAAASATVKATAGAAAAAGERGDKQGVPVANGNAGTAAAIAPSASAPSFGHSAAAVSAAATVGSRQSAGTGSGALQSARKPLISPGLKGSEREPAAAAAAVQGEAGDRVTGTITTAEPGAAAGVSAARSDGTSVVPSGGSNVSGSGRASKEGPGAHTPAAAAPPKAAQTAPTAAGAGRGGGKTSAITAAAAGGGGEAPARQESILGRKGVASSAASSAGPAVGSGVQPDGRKGPAGAGVAGSAASVGSMSEKAQGNAASSGGGTGAGKAVGPGRPVGTQVPPAAAAVPEVKVLVSRAAPAAKGASASALPPAAGRSGRSSSEGGGTITKGPSAKSVSAGTLPAAGGGGIGGRSSSEGGGAKAVPPPPSAAVKVSRPAPVAAAAAASDSRSLTAPATGAGSGTAPLSARRPADTATAAKACKEDLGAVIQQGSQHTQRQQQQKAAVASVRQPERGSVAGAQQGGLGRQQQLQQAQSAYAAAQARANPSARLVPRPKAGSAEAKKGGGWPGSQDQLAAAFAASINVQYTGSSDIRVVPRPGRGAGFQQQQAASVRPVPRPASAVASAEQEEKQHQELHGKQEQQQQQQGTLKGERGQPNQKQQQQLPAGQQQRPAAVGRVHDQLKVVQQQGVLERKKSQDSGPPGMQQQHQQQQQQPEQHKANTWPEHGSSSVLQQPHQQQQPHQHQQQPHQQQQQQAPSQRQYHVEEHLKPAYPHHQQQAPQEQQQQQRGQHYLQRQATQEDQQQQHSRLDQGPHQQDQQQHQSDRSYHMPRPQCGHQQEDFVSAAVVVPFPPQPLFGRKATLSLGTVQPLHQELPQAQQSKQVHHQQQQLQQPYERAWEQEHGQRGDQQQHQQQQQGELPIGGLGSPPQHLREQLLQKWHQHSSGGKQQEQQQVEVQERSHRQEGLKEPQFPPPPPPPHHHQQQQQQLEGSPIAAAQQMLRPPGLGALAAGSHVQQALPGSSRGYGSGREGPLVHVPNAVEQELQYQQQQQGQEGKQHWQQQQQQRSPQPSPQQQKGQPRLLSKWQQLEQGRHQPAQAQPLLQGQTQSQQQEQQQVFGRGNFEQQQQSHHHHQQQQQGEVVAGSLKSDVAKVPELLRPVPMPAAGLGHPRDTGSNDQKNLLSRPIPGRSSALQSPRSGLSEPAAPLHSGTQVIDHQPPPPPPASAIAAELRQEGSGGFSRTPKQQRVVTDFTQQQQKIWQDQQHDRRDVRGRSQHMPLARSPPQVQGSSLPSPSRAPAPPAEGQLPLPFRLGGLSGNKRLSESSAQRMQPAECAADRVPPPHPPPGSPPATVDNQRPDGEPFLVPSPPQLVFGPSPFVPLHMPGAFGGFPVFATPIGAPVPGMHLPFGLPFQGGPIPFPEQSTHQQQLLNHQQQLLAGVQMAWAQPEGGVHAGTPPGAGGSFPLAAAETEQQGAQREERGGGRQAGHGGHQQQQQEEADRGFREGDSQGDWWQEQQQQQLQRGGGYSRQGQPPRSPQQEQYSNRQPPQQQPQQQQQQQHQRYAGRQHGQLPWQHQQHGGRAGGGRGFGAVGSRGFSSPGGGRLNETIEAEVDKILRIKGGAPGSDDGDHSSESYYVESSDDGGSGSDPSSPANRLQPSGSAEVADVGDEGVRAAVAAGVDFTGFRAGAGTAPRVKTDLPNLLVPNLLRPEDANAASGLLHCATGGEGLPSTSPAGSSGDAAGVGGFCVGKGGTEGMAHTPRSWLRLQQQLPQKSPRFSSSVELVRNRAEEEEQKEGVQEKQGQEGAGLFGNSSRGMGPPLLQPQRDQQQQEEEGALLFGNSSRGGVVQPQLQWQQQQELVQQLEAIMAGITSSAGEGQEAQLGKLQEELLQGSMYLFRGQGVGEEQDVGEAAAAAARLLQGGLQGAAEEEEQGSGEQQQPQQQRQDPMAAAEGGSRIEGSDGEYISGDEGEEGEEGWDVDAVWDMVEKDGKVGQNLAVWGFKSHFGLLKVDELLSIEALPRRQYALIKSLLKKVLESCWLTESQVVDRFLSFPLPSLLGGTWALFTEVASDAVDFADAAAEGEASQSREYGVDCLRVAAATQSEEWRWWGHELQRQAGALLQMKTVVDVLSEFAEENREDLTPEADGKLEELVGSVDEACQVVMAQCRAAVGMQLCQGTDHARLHEAYVKLQECLPGYNPMRMHVDTLLSHFYHTSLGMVCVAVKGAGGSDREQLKQQYLGLCQRCSSEYTKQLVTLYSIAFMIDERDAEDVSANGAEGEGGSGHRAPRRTGGGVGAGGRGGSEGRGESEGRGGAGRGGGGRAGASRGGGRGSRSGNGGGDDADDDGSYGTVGEGEEEGDELFDSGEETDSEGEVSMDEFLDSEEYPMKSLILHQKVASGQELSQQEVEYMRGHGYGAMFMTGWSREDIWTVCPDANLDLFEHPEYHYDIPIDDTSMDFGSLQGGTALSTFYNSSTLQGWRGINDEEGSAEEQQEPDSPLRTDSSSRVASSLKGRVRLEQWWLQSIGTEGQEEWEARGSPAFVEEAKKQVSIPRVLE